MDAKKTILIIEDDQFLSSMYAEKFTLEGFHVLLALDGLTGLTMATESDPDIILLDLILPKLDGLSILKRIRSTKQAAHIPVVVLTNLGDTGQVEKGKALGADDYLVKAHFVPSEVVDRVRALLAA